MIRKKIRKKRKNWETDKYAENGSVDIYNFGKSYIYDSSVSLQFQLAPDLLKCPDGRGLCC